MGFSFDESRLPLLVVTFVGESTDAEFDAYLARMTQMVRRGSRYGVLFDARAAARPTPRQRQKQADWMKEYAPSLRANNAGIAFVIESAVVRGALTAILWLSPMPTSHNVVATVAQAEEWLAQLLANEGLSFPRRAS